MAEFHIKGHIKREGPIRFVAIVCAFQSTSGDSAFSEMVQEAAPTEALALEKLRELTVALGQRIRNKGGGIISVELRELTL